MKAFPLSNYSAAVASKDSVVVLMSGAAGVVVDGPESVQALADACVEAGAKTGTKLPIASFERVMYLAMRHTGVIDEGEQFAMSGTPTHFAFNHGELFAFVRELMK